MFRISRQTIRIKQFIVAITLLFVSGISPAGEYLATRMGTMIIKSDSIIPIYSMGLYYGYAFDQKLAIEAESNIGLIGGSYTDIENKQGKYNIWTVASYGTYRHALTSNFYAKAKAGVLFESVTNVTSKGRIVHADYGFSGGLGFGARFKDKLTLETEFVWLEKAIFYSGLGAHYRF